MTMHYREVSSSLLKKVGYDATRRLLEVTFHSKPGSPYQYANVTPKDYEKLMLADSIGSHFHVHIRQMPDKHPFRKVER